ncbi:anti-sigma factor family protein [Acidobacteriota bacterium]
MECLTSTKIQDYIEGTLNSVENAMVRDHLIVCAACKKKYNEYEALEKHLLQPVEITPPAIIERRVLRELFPLLPSYSSIFALIAASFVLLVTGIYIYFDFANNSIIQAIQLTSNTTSNWLASIIKVISTVFSAVYTVFEAMNRLLKLLLKINLGAEIIGLTVFVLFTLLFYPILKVAFRKLKG